MAIRLCVEDVECRNSQLPIFPRVISEILMTLSDPDANLKVLVRNIEHDPVVAGRVLFAANTAAICRNGTGNVRDIYTATSLIGFSRIRELVVVSSLSAFVRAMAANMRHVYWEHSVAVGVAAMELVHFSTARVTATESLVAGLLHDIGQLWLYRFYPDEFVTCQQQAANDGCGMDVAEQARFGADHAEIGAWLATSWVLPDSIVDAIRYHHATDKGITAPLAAVVHVAEVLSNALDLVGREENRVSHISAAACKTLGIVWDADIQPLFGRIEGRARHAAGYFKEAEKC